MILPHRIEGESIPVNKEHNMAIYSQHNNLEDQKNNFTNDKVSYFVVKGILTGSGNFLYVKELILLI